MPSVSAIASSILVGLSIMLTPFSPESIPRLNPLQLPAAVAAQPDPVLPGPPPIELPQINEIIIERFPALEVTASFRDDWGNRRSGSRRHQGTDVYASKGAPLVAVADGVVESMHAGGKGGFMLRVTHEDGWETWYMHLDNDTAGTDDGKAGEAAAFAEGIAVGDLVEAGQVVAYLGDSGNAEDGQPHLHFELHHRGKKVNPFPQLAHARVRYLNALAREASIL